MIVGFKIQSSLMQDAEKHAQAIQPDSPEHSAAGDGFHGRQLVQHELFKRILPGHWSGPLLGCEQYEKQVIYHDQHTGSGHQGESDESGVQPTVGPESPGQVGGEHADQAGVVQYEMNENAARPGHRPCGEAGKHVVRHAGDHHGQEPQQVEMNVNEAQALTPFRLDADHDAHHHPQRQINQSHSCKPIRVDIHCSPHPLFGRGPVPNS